MAISLVALSVVVSNLGIGFVQPAEAAGLSVASRLSASSAPATMVLHGAKLHDTTIMQGFAYDTKHNVWIASQLTQAGRGGLSGTDHARQGNITLTRLSPGGRELGYMFLRGFGHGVSIGVEPIGTKTYIWTEALAGSNGYGTAIARFEWRNGATYTAKDVTVYKMNNLQKHQTPAVDAANNLLVVRYTSEIYGKFRWAYYKLSDVKARNYTAQRRITRAPYPDAGVQGWTPNGTGGVIEWAGSAYGPDNPRPGNATLRQVDASGKVIKQTLVTAAPDLEHREPEGATSIGSNVCVGFASGPAGQRVANIVCQRKL